MSIVSACVSVSLVVYEGLVAYEGIVVAGLVGLVSECVSVSV